MNYKVTIDGKSIIIEVLKPILFESTMRALRENFHFRELIREPKNLKKNKDGNTYLYGAINLFGFVKRIKIAKFQSEDDEDLFCNGIKNSKDIKQILGEFEKEIIINTKI